MSVVTAYAQEMAFHVGDEREMLLCHKEYKRKLGPGMYREEMLKVRRVSQYGAEDSSSLPIASLRAVSLCCTLRDRRFSNGIPRPERAQGVDE